MSARQTLAIDDDVRRILVKDVAIDGNRVRIVPRIDRGLYLRVAAVLEALGGRWVTKEGAHVFGRDPSRLIREGLATGEVERLVVKYQFYETPHELAADMVGRLRLSPRERFLDPSAGRGRLIVPALKAGANVSAIELWDANIPHLESLLARDRITHADFLSLRPVGRQYPAIAMNPPFVGQQASAHIRWAYDHWLAVGGRMVALCDAGALVNSSTADRAFQAWCGRVGAIVADLPRGTFAQSGTQVAATLIYIRKARA